MQGFEVTEHPWDDAYKERAFAIIEDKIDPADKSSELMGKIRRARNREEQLGAELDDELSDWHLKAAGELAQEGLLDWLGSTPAERPFFAFLNYMEAHRQFIPPEACRRAFMTDEEIVASYAADRSWNTMWSYTLGMHEYEPEELDVMALTYDACILELDQLLERLIGALDAAGHLDDTIVVLTGDHGEHLGEHHMLDHQYSLYEGLVRVPMVLWYPKEVPAGRSDDPVQNFDVFPTLLELARIAPPPGLRSRAVSLLDPDPDRQRVAEYPSPFDGGIAIVEKRYGDAFDPAPFRRTLRALYEGCDKLIVGSDGSRELYDVCGDGGETDDLARARGERADVLEGLLEGVVGSLRTFDPTEVELEGLDEETLRRLRGLGY